MKKKFRQILSVLAVALILMPYTNVHSVFAITSGDDEVSQNSSSSSDSSTSSSDTGTSTSETTEPSSNEASSSSQSEISNSSDTQTQASSATLAKLEDDSAALSVIVEATQGGFAEGSSVKLDWYKPTSDKQMTDYNQTVSLLQEQLQSSQLQVNAVQIFNLTYLDASGQEQSPSLATKVSLNFKDALALRGLNADNSNAHIAVIGQNGQIVQTAPNLTWDNSGKLVAADFEATSSNRLILYTTTAKQDKTTVGLGTYGSMDLDASVFQSDNANYGPDYSKRVVVRLHIAKLSEYEDVPEDELYKNEEIVSYISTWNNQLTISSINLSSNYLVMRAKYKEAHTDASVLQLAPEGDYATSSYLDTDGKSSQGILDLYISEVPTSSPRRTTRAIPGGVITNVPADSVLSHKKRIDYLGDGVNNPDTSVDDAGTTHDTSDLHRLYLDITGTDTPINVLIMVDKSNSMTLAINSNTSTRRDQVLFNAVNGSGSSKGLMQTILDLNPNNKIAVAEFHGFYNTSDIQAVSPGSNTQNISRYSKTGRTDINRDSTVIRDWGRNATSIPRSNGSTAYPNRFADLEGEGYNGAAHGTNYSAAYATANYLFRSNSIANDGNRKIMIFISDGVPTFYYNSSTEGALRSGNGIAGETTQTQNRFTEFYNELPGVTTYTVGVSGDINGNGSNSSPTVMRYMANLSGGAYYKAESADELTANLQNIIESTKASNVSITDELSQYVNWYTARPDAKVTRTNKTTGAVQTLYVNGAITGQGQGILDPTAPITYTATNSSTSTGKVTVKFANSHSMDSSWTYTLSFNTQVTDRAYLDYKNASGSYSQRGQADTDYGNNSTSSNQSGFRSNSEAYAIYNLGSRTYGVYYDHPVVQVKTNNFRLVKVDLQNTSKTLSGVKFELRLEDKTTVWTSPQTDNSGIVNLNYLRRGKTYYLYETKAANGYQLLTQPWRIVVSADGRSIEVYDQNNQKLSANSSGNILITNKQLYQLPSTGGPGPFINTIVGVTLIASVLLIYLDHKKKRNTTS